jgi:hypothetical protein
VELLLTSIEQTEIPVILMLLLITAIWVVLVSGVID